MDLNSAVQFSNDLSWGEDTDIKKIIDEFRIRTQDLGFYDQRMTYNNYHENMEDELKAAYDETIKLEKDMRNLLTITDVLVDKTDEYEQRIADMSNEKDDVHSTTNYMQENIEAMLEKDRDKDAKILQMEGDLNYKDKTIKKLNATMQQLQYQVQDMEEELENIRDEDSRKKEMLAEKEEEFDDKMRSLQDLIEYKDEHINELQDSLDKLDERLEQFEKERDTLERNLEQSSKDLNETKNNMTHYRTSCQNLSRELHAANDNIIELENRYEILLRKGNDAAIKRMNSNSSLGSIENQLIGSDDEAQQTQPEKEEEPADTLDDELGELEDMQGMRCSHHVPNITYRLHGRR